MAIEPTRATCLYALVSIYSFFLDAYWIPLLYCTTIFVCALLSSAKFIPSFIPC